MEWVEDLHGKTVGIDTAPLIYFIEEHPVYLSVVKPFFEAVDKGEVRAATSTVSLLEVLVHPYRKNDNELVEEYRDILLHSKLITNEITSRIAELAAKLRATRNLRTPDSIQIAAAIDSDASYFLTNDKNLPEINGIKILTLDALLP